MSHRGMFAAFGSVARITSPTPFQTNRAHAKSDSKFWRSTFPLLLMVMQDDQRTSHRQVFSNHPFPWPGKQRLLT